MKKLILIPTVVFTSVVTHAALTVTNGNFGTTSMNGATVSGGGWFESGTTNWIEGSWTNGNTTTFPSGTGAALLFDGGTGTLGYVYQSLGFVTAGEIASGNLQIRADFAEKTDGETNDAVFSFYKGTFTGATGTDIARQLYTDCDGPRSDFRVG